MVIPFDDQMLKYAFVLFDLFAPMTEIPNPQALLFQHSYTDYTDFTNDRVLQRRTVYIP